METNNTTEFEIKNKDVLNYVAGGFSDNRLKMLVRTQKCNCGKFKSKYSCLNIDICDNCSHAVSSYPSSDFIFCKKQPKSRL